MGVNSRQLGQVRFSPMDNSISSIQFKIGTNRWKLIELCKNKHKENQLGVGKHT